MAISFDARPMWAEPVSTTSIRVSWLLPQGTQYRRVLLHSRTGVPDNPDRERSRIVLDVNSAIGSTDPNLSTQTILDEGLTAGTEAHYAMYVLAPGADPSTQKWYLAGSVSTALPVEPDYQTSMAALLPTAFTTEGGGSVNSLAEPSVLTSLADALTWMSDRTRSDIDRLLLMYDSYNSPAAFLSAWSQTMGIIPEVALTDRARRELIRNAVRTYNSKGTSTSARLIAESVTGITSQIDDQPNLLPSYFLSGFEQEDSDLVTATLASAPQQVSSALWRVTLKGRPQFPVSSINDPVYLVTPPALATLQAANGDREHILILERHAIDESTTTYDIVRGYKATKRSTNFTTNDILRLNHNYSWWTTPAGYVTEICKPTSGEPAAPTWSANTEERTLFPIRNSFRMKMTRSNSGTVPAPLLSFLPQHTVSVFEDYNAEDSLVISEQPNSLKIGDAVTLTVPSMSISAARYYVTNVLDARRFRISRRSNAFSALDQTSQSGSVSPFFTCREASRAVTVQPGEFYTLSAYLACDASTTGRVRIVWLDSNFSQVSVSDHSGSVSSTFSRVSVSAEAPSTARFAGFQIETDAIANGKSVWVDNVQFELGNAASEYTDGGGMIVNLGVPLSTDPDQVLRKRLRDLLPMTIPAGRTAIVRLPSDAQVSISPSNYFYVAYDPVEQFYDNVNPDTTSAFGLEPDDLSVSSDTYIPAFDPESVVSVSGDEDLEIVFRGSFSVSTGASPKLLAAQRGAEGDRFLWRVFLEPASTGYATIRFAINDSSKDLGTYWEYSAVVPASTSVTRWYRIRLRATGDNFSSGAVATISVADDSSEEPRTWTVEGTSSQHSVVFNATPGWVYLGYATSGATFAARYFKISGIAQFDARDLSNDTAQNVLGSDQSAFWVKGA